VPVGSNWAGDDHPSTATHANEHLSGHRQVTALEAAENGWYWRPSARSQLEPDTRKCGCHGEIHFPALPLTDAEKRIRHPLSTQVLLHEDGF
jgi:hypothetical protein